MSGPKQLDQNIGSYSEVFSGPYDELTDLPVVGNRTEACLKLHLLDFRAVGLDEEQDDFLFQNANCVGNREGGTLLSGEFEFVPEGMYPTIVGRIQGARVVTVYVGLHSNIRPFIQARLASAKTMRLLAIGHLEVSPVEQCRYEFEKEHLYPVEWSGIYRYSRCWQSFGSLLSIDSVDELRFNGSTRDAFVLAKFLD